MANKIDNNFFYAPGMGFLVRSSIVKEIGYFDQNIFLYWDDVDFSWRVRLLGYDIEINPDAINYHKQYVSSGKQKNPFKIYHREFSWLYVLFKNLKFHSFLKYLVFYVNIIIIKTLYSLKNRHFILATLKAYFKFLSEIKTNISMHKRVQAEEKLRKKKS